MLPPFYNSKISIPNKSVSSFEKMTLVQGRGRPLQREYIFEAYTSFLSSGSNHKNPLEPNEPQFLNKTPTRLFKTATNDASQYIKKNIQQIIQTIIQAQVLKEGTREKPPEAKSPNVYRSISHMRYFNFCQ